MPGKLFFGFEDSGRSANQPARPESGVLGVGGIRHWARLALTSAKRLTQDLKSCCHSSVLQAPPGARKTPPPGAASAPCGAATAQTIDATTVTNIVITNATVRRTISNLQVGRRHREGRRCCLGCCGGRVQVLQ